MSSKPNGDSKFEDGAANFNEDGGTTIVMTDGIDPVTVCFINGKEKDKETKSDNGEFVGLRKEELVKFASDPYWVKLRIILLVIFALVWIGMLVGAIVIIVLAPRCPPRPHQEWWEKAVIYHIHPLSFQDSKTDGYGDLNGILSRLDYLKNELKVDAISLGPIYPAGFEDAGYDVKNYIQPCPGHYGEWKDFENLVAAVHKKGMKLILDFIPNHTSRKHGWFLNSVNKTGGDPKYQNFYIWADRVNGGPPNNWTNVHGESAWTWNEVREQYYYHTFSSNLPDLNLRDEFVKKQFETVLQTWLDKKVDGFTVRDAQYLIEPNITDPNPNITDPNPNITDPNPNITNPNPSPLHFRPESVELVAEWRKIIDDFTAEESKSRSQKISRVLIADVKGTPEETIPFYKDSVTGANLVTNKALVELGKDCDSACVLTLINRGTAAASNFTANWQVGNVDSSRIASRYEGSDYLNAANLLLMTLGGTTFTLYGDELGIRDATKNASDPHKRVQLTPMQWNNSDNAGFTGPKAKPWMPVADDFKLTSLQTQEAHGSGMNHFGAFQRYVELRSKSESLRWGELKGVTVQGGVLMYMRQAVGFNRLLVAINFGPESSTVDFAEYERVWFDEDRRLPAQMTIVTSTFNFRGADRVDAYNNGTTIDPLKMIFLEPKEGVVLSWGPTADQK